MGAFIVKEGNIECYIWDASKECTAEDKLLKKVSVGAIGAEATDVDVTSMEDEYKRSASGTKDVKAIPIVQYLYTDEYTKMFALWTTGADIKFAFIYKNASGEVFQTINGDAHITNIEMGDAAVDSAVQVTTTIKPDGPLLSDFVAPAA